MAETIAQLDWRSVGAETIIILALLLVGFGLILLTQRARRTPFQLGVDFGTSRAVVQSWSGNSGYVRIGGELWKARAKCAFSPGDSVEVARIEGMLLNVRKA